jgi:hypothetical protein
VTNDEFDKYRLRLQLQGGRTYEVSSKLRRTRSVVGSIVNLPLRPDGAGREGKGYIWRVVEVDEEGTLVLAFEGPHPEQDDPDYS